MSRLPACLLATLAALAACGDDLAPPAPEPTDDGASLLAFTPAERQRVIAAARGQDAEVALFVYHAYRDGGGACPRRETVDQMTVLTGGCTTPSGDRISGRIVASGSSALPRSLVFDGFAVNGATDLVIDGEIGSVRDPDGRWTRSHALTMVRGDVGVRTDMTVRCAGADCTIDAGGAVEVLGHPPVTPSRVGRVITLAGADRLVHELALDADCGDYDVYLGADTTPTLEGSACLWTRGGAATIDPSAALRGFTYACADGALTATVEASREGQVTLQLPTRFLWNGRFAPASPEPVIASASFERLVADDRGALVATAPVQALTCDGAAEVMGWHGTLVTPAGERHDSIELFAVPPVRLDR